MELILEKYQIDKQQTIKAVETALQQYRSFKTACALRSFSNARTAKERKLEYIEVVETAVEHLENDNERDFLKRIYMVPKKINWLQACDQLYLNKTDYYKLRKKALLALAINLNIEIYSI